MSITSTQFLGNFHLAIWTSLTLRHYEDLLNVEQIYSIIALAAIGNGSYNIVSRAFMKLESLKTVSNHPSMFIYTLVSFFCFTEKKL